MTRLESLKKFLEKTDEIINGNYLFATKKMEELAELANDSQILFEIFEYCVDGFDYEYYKQKLSRKGEKPIPETPKEQLAYCFRLLSDIGLGRRDLQEYLHENFYINNSYFDSYSEFCKAVVVPFKFLVKATVEDVIEKSEQMNADEQHSIDIDFKYLEEIVRLLEDDKYRIQASGLKDDQKKETITILDSFIERANNKEIMSLYSNYIGYKHVVLGLKKMNTNYEAITEMLTDHGIIK